MMFSDANKTEGGVFQILKHIPHSYTILPEVEQGWRWGNSVISLLVPQRGFLLGIPLAVIVFTQWWAAMNTAKSKVQGAKGKETRSTERLQGPLTDASPFALGSLLSRRMLTAGVLAGLLPLIHAHSFRSEEHTSELQSRVDLVCR